MAVDKVVTNSADALVLHLLNSDDEVSGEAIVGRVTFTDKSQNSARLHARFHLYLLLNVHSLLSESVALRRNPAEAEHLGAAVEELEQGTATLDLEVGGVGVLTLRDRILVQVALYPLNHLNLFAGFVESNSVGVARSEENLEHLEGIAIEGIA